MAELTARARVRTRAQDPWATAAEEYWVPFAERRFIHRPFCECQCGAVVAKDEDAVGGYRCVKCGRPPR
jgi:hypothetical protein